VWKSTLNGRVLHFQLAGINNQNFIMQDLETHSWWQQASGKAILGPLQGNQLGAVLFQEESFALWKEENPFGQILLPDRQLQNDYAKSDWEQIIQGDPTVTPLDPHDPLKPRDLVVGIQVQGSAKAYPMPVLLAQNPIMDTVGGSPLFLVVALDKHSVRCFDRRVAEKDLEFFLKSNTQPLRFIDGQTGSEWDFSGKSVSGALVGNKLKEIQILKDFWFDWKLYHPATSIFRAGIRQGIMKDEG
jgi:hypothetical protein